MKNKKEIQAEREKLFELTQLAKPSNALQFLMLLMIIDMTLKWVTGDSKPPSEQLRKMLTEINEEDEKIKS